MPCVGVLRPFPFHTAFIKRKPLGAGAHLERPAKGISLAVLFPVIPCTAPRGEGALGLPSALVPWGWLLTVGGRSRVAEGCWCCWTIDTFRRVSVGSGMFSPSRRTAGTALCWRAAPTASPTENYMGLFFFGELLSKIQKNQMPFCTSGIYQGREGP